MVRQATIFKQIGNVHAESGKSCKKVRALLCRRVVTKNVIDAHNCLGGFSVASHVARNTCDFFRLTDRNTMLEPMTRTSWMPPEALCSIEEKSMSSSWFEGIFVRGSLLNH